MKTKANRSSRSRLRSAILIGQALSYGLIITFIFADHLYNLTGPVSGSRSGVSLQGAMVAACLVCMVATVNLWLSWHYMRKSSAMSEMLVICAWTHRVKHDGKWIALEEFFMDQLGYAISHGLSDKKLFEMRQELDRDWKTIPIETNAKSDHDKPPIGLSPAKQNSREQAAPLHHATHSNT